MTEPRPYEQLLIREERSKQIGWNSLGGRNKELSRRLIQACFSEPLYDDLDKVVELDVALDQHLAFCRKIRPEVQQFLIKALRFFGSSQQSQRGRLGQRIPENRWSFETHGLQKGLFNLPAAQAIEPQGIVDYRSV